MFIKLKDELLSKQLVWLITGAAGFIGSNILEQLLKLNQTVIGMDNLSTGNLYNIDIALSKVSQHQSKRFNFIQGDISDISNCQTCCEGVDIVLHQAALGSVKLSLEDPISSHRSNVDGFVNMLIAARDTKVKRFIYASSSAVYGDANQLPVMEENTGNPISPYAATKLTNEIYANVFARCYGLECIGLRYFNIYGPRQDPNGPYAAVIPKWIASLLHGEAVYIYGDGNTTRDFCYIDDVIQANLLAATVNNDEAIGEVFNIALGESISLNQLFYLISDIIKTEKPKLTISNPVYSDFRPGDVRHSLSDISKAKKYLDYRPTHTVRDGLKEYIHWFVENSM